MAIRRGNPFSQVGDREENLRVRGEVFGALAGLAGVTEVMGVHHRMSDQFSAGFGFTGIAVALMVFAVAWHAYQPERSTSVVVLACGFLAVGLVDFGHVLSYDGMPAFVTPAGTQKSISFWLFARILAGLTLVCVASLPSRPLARPGLRYALLACALLAAAGSYGLVLFRPGLLPVFFSAGEGLTHAKIATELTAVGLTLVAMLRLWRTRAEPREFDAEGVVTACLLLVLASLSLLLYVNVHDGFSLLGHAYKVAACYVLYRVVFVASVRQPYERLAIEIAEKEEALQQVRTLETIDSLTGLPNRAHLREEATLALAARRHDGARPALLIASVDGFASITDSHGHAFGDRVLRIVADRLERLRPLGAAFRAPRPRPDLSAREEEMEQVIEGLNEIIGA